MTDNEIIEYLRQNKYSKALKGLYACLHQVKKHILENNGNNDDVQDVFQDALVILYKKVQEPSFSLTSSLQTYTVAIVKNIWHQELRRKNKFQTTEVIDIAQETVPDETENFTNANAAFNLLGEKCKQLLTLFYHKKLSFKEIAAQLAFSDEKTAKNQKYRCLQKAKENYNTLTLK